MPKIEEPKKEKKAGGAAKKVVKTVARLNMMDELKAKQAAMKKANILLMKQLNVAQRLLNRKMAYGNQKQNNYSIPPRL